MPIKAPESIQSGEVRQIPYNLHEGQFEVYTNDSRFKVLVAGRRWGKTCLAIIFLITEAFKHEEAKVWYVSPFLSQSKNIAWKLLKKMLDPQTIVKINESELSVTLTGGREIYLKGADHPESLLGVGLNAVVLDEYASMKQDVWQEIIRPMLTDTMGKALFIGTPKGKNHFWELFLLGLKNEQGFSSWTFRTVDNPHIPPEDVELAKQQLNERFFRQEYEASFEDFTGLVYPEFSDKVHVINELPNLAKMESLIAIDPALTGVHAWLLAYADSEGALYVIEEYYEKNKRVSEVASIMPKAGLYLIDPSGYNKSILKEGHLFAIADEYKEWNIPVRPAENDVDAGVNRVGEFFKRNKIRIHSSCKNLIWELKRYHWSEERETVRGVSVAKPYKKDDHLCDCLRYIVMSRYSADIVQPVLKYGLKSLYAYNKRDKEKARDLGRRFA